MKRFDKLVRDRILEIIRKNGETPVYRKLEDNDEYLRALLEKDVEEGLELAENPCLEELADKLEVLYAIADVLGISHEELEAARAQKALERGAFKDRLFLEYTE